MKLFTKILFNNNITLKPIKLLKNLNTLAVSAGLLVLAPISNNTYASTPDVCKDKLTQTTAKKNVFQENISGVTSANLTNNFCLGSPDKFEITIYEMGLCTQNPISGSPKAFSKENCVTSMASTGSTADLAGKTVDLPKATNRPPNDTYTYAYMVILNEFGLKGTISLAGNVYCSNSSGLVNSSAGCTAEAHTEELDDFGDSETDDIGNADFGPETMPVSAGGGKVSALLTDSSLTRAEKVSQVTRLVAVFETNSGTPVVITDNTNGLEVELQVADFGYGIMFNNAGVPVDFGSSPFRPVFNTF